MTIPLKEINQYLDKKFKGLDRNMRAKLAVAMQAQICAEDGCSNERAKGSRICKDCEKQLKRQGRKIL